MSTVRLNSFPCINCPENTFIVHLHAIFSDSYVTLHHILSELYVKLHPILSELYVNLHPILS